MTTRRTLSTSARLLAGALLALAVLYFAWFGRRPAPWAELVVFALPPLLLAAALAWPRLRAHAGFWAGVLALAWFSHGVMVAWTRIAERGYALLEIALALLVVFTASMPGLRARFGRTHLR